MTKTVDYVKTLEPIFLHAFWRTASTYVWSCFRRLDNTVAYYEPYHWLHRHLNNEQIIKHTPDTWQSSHPAGIAPYFTEYQSLIGYPHGTKNYDPRLSSELFFADGGLERIDRDYLQFLLDSAGQRRRQPVFGFCRSLGRTGGIANAFGGTHIIVLREPFGTLNSVLKSDMLGHFAQIALSPRNAHLLSRMGLQYERFDLNKDCLSNEQAFAWAVSNRVLAVFVFFHLYLIGYFCGLLYADSVIEMETLSDDTSYRKRCETNIRDRTGLEIAFDDCNMVNKYDFVGPDIVSLMDLTDYLKGSVFNHADTLATEIALLQGIPVKNDPEREMLRLERIYFKSLADRLFVGENDMRSHQEESQVSYRFMEMLGPIDRDRNIQRQRANQLERDLEISKKQVVSLAAQNRKMRASLSWKLAAPIRVIQNIARKTRREILGRLIYGFKLIISFWRK